MARRPPFCWVYLIFRFFGRPGLGPIWARFWRVWASILKVFWVHFGGFWSRFGSHVACNFGNFLSCSFLKLPLVRDGLVGLREGQRILIDLGVEVASHNFFFPGRVA